LTFRPRTLAAAVLICLAPAAAVGATAAQAASWSKPFELTTPGTLDYSQPQLAIANAGAASAAFSIGDVDTPGADQAYLVSRSAAGKVGASQTVTGAKQVLALAYSGRTLELLTGEAGAQDDCCSTVAAVRVSSAGKAGRAKALVGGLAGATQAQLLTLGDGRLTAAVATERGVWAAQSSRGGAFGRSHLISDKGQEPISMSAAWLGGDSSIVAWTYGTGLVGANSPRTIDYARGSRSGAPHRARAALTVASGHRVDELQVVRDGSGSTLVWVESWFDKHGAYHSQVQQAELGAKHPSVHALSPANRLASSLSAAADPAGDQAVSWESCTSAGGCTVQLAGRPAKGSFGKPHTLGPIDSYQSPDLAISPKGQVLVGWVNGGRPVASVGFGSPTTLSTSTYASDVTVASGSRGQALEAWTQGTLHPSVVAAYRK
jgi:hypothetical protein